jgi:hypothetical protein
MTALALPRPVVRAAASRPVTEAGAALAIAAVAVAGTYFVDRWGLGRGLIAAGGVIALLWMATTRRTLVALGFFMVYLGCLDGYLKLSTGSTPVTLIRDALLFALVLGLLARVAISGERYRLPPLTALVVAFVALVLVQFLNPEAGTVAHSLAGARQHLEFIPLFFLAFGFLRTTKALRGFVVLLLLIATANGVAGYVQFKSTPAQFAKWGPGYAERVLGTGRFSEAGRTFASRAETNGTRPFGLGSDAGAGGIVAAFALAGVLALASLYHRKRYLVFAAVMAMSMGLAIVSSQSRSAVTASFLVVLTYGLLTAVSNRRIVSLLGVGVAALLAFAVFQGVVGSVGASKVRYSGLTATKIVGETETARGGSIAQIPATFAHYPVGIGLGTSGVAAGFAGASKWSGIIDAETWFSFMTTEVGIAGMLVLLALTLSVFGLGLTRVRREPDDEARALLAAVIAPLGAIIALYFSGGAVTATTPGGPYLWTVAGIVSYWLIARPKELQRTTALAASP